MTIVVKLGGTNGSGKTSVARALLDKMSKRSGPDFKVTTGVIEGKRWEVIGSYKNICGGMDTISDKEERLTLVRGAAECGMHHVVFFEGLITGKTYGAFGAMSEEPQHKGNWIYAFMDTPFDVCVARVLERRAAKLGQRGYGNPSAAPFNPQRTMLPTYKAVQSTAKRAAAQGHRVLWLPHAKPPSVIADILIKEVAEFTDVRR